MEEQAKSYSNEPFWQFIEIIERYWLALMKIWQLHFFFMSIVNHDQFYSNPHASYFGLFM